MFRRSEKIEVFVYDREDLEEQLKGYRVSFSEDVSLDAILACFAPTSVLKEVSRYELTTLQGQLFSEWVSSLGVEDELYLSGSSHLGCLLNVALIHQLVKTTDLTGYMNVRVTPYHKGVFQRVLNLFLNLDVQSLVYLRLEGEKTEVERLEEESEFSALAFGLEGSVSSRGYYRGTPMRYERGSLGDSRF